MSLKIEYAGGKNSNFNWHFESPNHGNSGESNEIGLVGSSDNFMVSNDESSPVPLNNVGLINDNSSKDLENSNPNTELLTSLLSSFADKINDKIEETVRNCISDKVNRNFMHSFYSLIYLTL